MNNIQCTKKRGEGSQNKQWALYKFYILGSALIKHFWTSGWALVRGWAMGAYSNNHGISISIPGLRVQQSETGQLPYFTMTSLVVYSNTNKITHSLFCTECKDFCRKLENVYIL